MRQCANSPFRIVLLFDAIFLICQRKMHPESDLHMNIQISLKIQYSWDFSTRENNRARKKKYTLIGQRQIAMSSCHLGSSHVVNVLRGQWLSFICIRSLFRDSLGLVSEPPAACQVVRNSWDDCMINTSGCHRSHVSMHSGPTGTERRNGRKN